MSKSKIVVFCSSKATCEFAVDCVNKGDRLYTRNSNPAEAYKCCHTPAIVRALIEELESLTVKQLKEKGLSLSNVFTNSFVEERIAALGFSFKWTLGIDRKLIISFFEVDSDPKKLEQDAVKAFSDIPTIQVIVDEIQVKTLKG